MVIFTSFPVFSTHLCIPCRKRAKVANLPTCPVNRQKIEVFFCELNISNFMKQHLFSCVNPLLLCYRVLNLGKVTIFLSFYIFDRKFDNGHSDLKNENLTVLRLHLSL